MARVYTVSGHRALEAAAFARRDSFAVMQQAGAAVAQQAMKLCPSKQARIALVAGAGNNGGDAYIAAAALQQAGYAQVQMFAAAPTNPNAADAQKAKQLWTQGQGDTETQRAAFAATPAALIVDGLYGIGLNRPLSSGDCEWVAAINEQRKRGAQVLSIDIPSGVDADSGEVLGAAVRADATISFFGGKLGLWTGAGRDCAGRVIIDDLGMSEDDEKSTLHSGDLINGIVPPAAFDRSAESHKGSYGNIALVGGSDGMAGALVLAARAAAVMGAGKVFAVSTAAAAHRPQLDWQHPEIMWRDIGAVKNNSINAQVIAAGMGLGLDKSKESLLVALAKKPATLLLDADALTILADSEPLKRALKARKHPTILTPHPGEAARLLERGDSAEVNAHRLASVHAIALVYNSIVVLKGAGTLVCAITEGHREWGLCAAGNAGLARGGSGDVLSGIIGAALLQIPNPYAATCTAVWLHAAAADMLANEHGMLALNINELAPTAARLALQK